MPTEGGGAPARGQAALKLYARKAGVYDRQSRALNRYRERAVRRLECKPGQTVIDVACGTGLNFASIERAIGPQGRLIGVDVSAEMLEIAERRVEREGWQNVVLIGASVEEAAFGRQADAALFCLTHDVLQSRRAVQNVVAHLRADARIASIGAKSAPTWRVPVNVAVRWLARRYVTTLRGMDQPWRLLAEVAEIELESVALGGAYIAWGRKRG